MKFAAHPYKRYKSIGFDAGHTTFIGGIYVFEIAGRRHGDNQVATAVVE
jgi:hypothetical protein